MGYNNAVLCIVILNMIVMCKTWPQKQGLNFQKGEVFPKTATKDSLSDVVIHFPGENNSEDIRDDYSADGKGLNCIENVCEDAKDYPYDYIRTMLKKIPHYEHLFGYLDGTLVDQGSRVQIDEETQPKSLCATILQTKYPKTLINLHNVTKYIVNFDNYKQGIVFETCATNAHCGEASFPAGYVSKCAQRHSTIRLVAVEKEKAKEPALDSFVIPSCCVCTLEKVV